MSVADGTEVEIKLMDGDVLLNMGDPESLRWSHDGFSSDIIAYRVVEEAREEFTPARLLRMSGNRAGRLRLCCYEQAL